ncbi:hypothetical protein D0865_15428 [Hortaea werneckii]|uniref:Actin-like ATPase domain-containing protein n=1 Tax=Hortaea werneckii TaxID=91943 RepID=A0A3M7AQI7_HORWE|nr:hypothetical protein D0865_15428 [Hortaea werneckii]
MPPFRDDQLFIIAPGSETTLAQLGLPESFTPARYHVRSRMFPAENPGEFEPVKIRRKEKPAVNGAASEEQPKPQEDGETEWEEDHISEHGAIWPIRNGQIVDWPCFYALMTHVFNTVNPPFHTPVLLISEPVWATKEHERVTQFFFEKFKVPAFTMVDAAMAASYAYGVTTATIVDVGHTKADVTCVVESMLHDVGRGIAVPGCGGEALTERLWQVLKGRSGFSREMCEQLKKSNICEILPSDVEQPGDESAIADDANPAAAASTGEGQRKPSGAAGDLPKGPGEGTQAGEEKKLEDDEGVLDIASIVTGGNMGDYLAQKEREKQEKAATKQKKGSDAGQQANRPMKLPNNKRTRNTFVYEDFALHEAMKKAGMSDQKMADMQSAMDEGPNKRQKTPEPQGAPSEKPADGGVDGQQQEEPPSPAGPSPSGGFRREIEVGPERFQAATSAGGQPSILDRLADSIHRTVQSCPDINRRSDLWDSLIILGNGSHVRGFKEALLETLQKKFIISPSSATIFTSELPSNMSTPMATGANTPQPQYPGQHQQQQQHQGVNPMLLAATTAQHQHLQQQPNQGSFTPQQQMQMQMQHHSLHSSHAQTPTSIKLAKIPDYFPEWKETGYDEATFLGAQVAAKVLFVVDAGASKAYMSRTDYNEQGPGGIHEVML